MSDFHCPNCGASFGPQLASTRMMNCEFCGTSVVIDSDRLRLAGSQGVMHEAPLLFGLKDTVTLERTTWRILGHARFSYGRGTWDEFWAVDAGDPETGAWISVDEGDVVVQSPIEDPPWDAAAIPPELGAQVSFRGRTYRATEVETALCEAVRGSFPEVLVVGETYRFINFTGEDADLLSAEVWPEGQAWYVGAWVDPFDVKRTAS